MAGKERGFVCLALMFSSQSELLTESVIIIFLKKKAILPKHVEHHQLPPITQELTFIENNRTPPNPSMKSISLSQKTLKNGVKILGSDCFKSLRQQVVNFKEHTEMTRASIFGIENHYAILQSRKISQ